MSSPLDGLYQQFKDPPLNPNRPFVTLTYAQSLDGSIASSTRKPLALSNDETFKMTHSLRSLHDAILIGIGTLLTDDPQLNVRLVDGRDPQPIVLDTRLRTPLGARLFNKPPHPWLAASNEIDPTRHEKFTTASARILTTTTEPSGLLNLEDLLSQLPSRGIGLLIVEGGARVITSFLRARLVDLIVLTISPMIVGGLTAVQAAADESSFPLRLEGSNWVELDGNLVYWGIPQWSEA